MASLVLLVSQFLKHPNADLDYSTTSSSMSFSSSTGATAKNAAGAPCFTKKQPAATTPADRKEDFEEDLSVLSVCVDLFWL